MPQLRMRDAANVLRTITQIRMRDAGNVLRVIQQIRMRDASNVLRVVWTGEKVTLDSYYEYQSSTGGSSGTIVSDPITATPNFGTGPYAYLWYRTSGSGGMTIDTPTAATTTFRQAMISGVTRTATFKCRVTDSLGAVEYSDQLDVELEYI